jgi:hypothetical protein
MHDAGVTAAPNVQWQQGDTDRLTQPLSPSAGPRAQERHDG